jgi:hypothetical protein
LRPLKDYKFGTAYRMAEYLGASLKDRLKQARWYGDIAINFVGTEENFEDVPGASRLSTRDRDNRRNAEVLSSLWRARLLGCGMASDAVMMLCHPQWYGEVMAANQIQPDERLSVADQLKAMEAFNIMSAEIHPKHGASGASPVLPTLQAWEEMQGRPGQGLLMPNGTVLPEALARQFTGATGLVVVHEGILDKLAEIAKFRTSIDELMAMIITESRASAKSRLGPQVGSEGTAGNSQVRLLEETGERRKEDHPQRPPPATPSASRVVTPAPSARATPGPKEVRAPAPPSAPATTPAPMAPASAQEALADDLTEAGQNVKDMQFICEDHDELEAEDTPINEDTESDDCMIIERCQPIKREVKSPKAEVFDEPMEQEEAVDPTQDRQGDLTAPKDEVVITAAAVGLKEEDIKQPQEMQVVASPSHIKEVLTVQLPSPPIRGQSVLRSASFRIAGESPSDLSGTDSNDEAFQTAAGKRTSGNISPQDLDPDNIANIGGRIKWSNPKKKKKRRNKRASGRGPYTGVPYKQPKDDDRDENVEVESTNIVEPLEVKGIETPYKQPEDDIPDTVVTVPRVDLVRCLEFTEGHLSYPAPMPFETPARACRVPLCLARQTWYDFNDYDDLEHNYYDTKSREQATRDAAMTFGTTYDLTMEGRETRKIFVFGSSSQKSHASTTNWLRLRDLLIRAGFFASIAGTAIVSADLEGYTSRALESYVNSEDLTSEMRKNAFTVLHMAAPNSVVVQVRVIWDGKPLSQPHGQRIPYELATILKDPRIRKIGFGLLEDAHKLASVGIEMRSVCDMANLVLMAWPQMEKETPKTGKMFVKKMLNAPCPLYSKLEDKPEDQEGIRINYEFMDFTKPVDQWHWHWSFYNAMDHYLAFGLLDFLSARAADLDGLNMDADVVRYQVALLDAVRDLPDVGIPRRDANMAFAVGKAETDEERNATRPWPIVKDSPIYNSLRKRRAFTSSLKMKHKLDMAHYSETYLKFLEGQMQTPMPEWDKWNKHGHSEWFNCIGKHFPHACDGCGSFEHENERCDSTASCEYPYCLGLDHETLVCPMILKRCGICGALGHTEHGIDSTVTLEANFEAAKHVHIIASRLGNKRLAYRVQKNNETGALEVVEETSPYYKKLASDRAPK